MVTGAFQIGQYYSSYAKLNSDGASTAAYLYAPVGRRIEPLADGKFVVCGGRLVGDEDYWLSHRLNADGSVDPSYRVTVGNGACQDIAVLPDGKILLAGFISTPNNAPLPGIQRLHPDGTRDTSFNLGGAAAYLGVREIAVQADGKIVAPYCCRPGPPSNRTAVNRFNTDGSLDLDLSNCATNIEYETAMLPLGTGNIMMSGCQKWQGGGGYQFAEMAPDGRIAPGLDRIDFDSPVTDIVSGVNGEYYVVGRFTEIDDVPLVTLARLKPYVAPIKPKFDFDGDGRSDLSVFRPSDRYWYLNRSAAGYGYFQWGLTTDTLIAANYDADDKTNIGIYRGDGRRRGRCSDPGTIAISGEPYLEIPTCVKA